MFLHVSADVPSQSMQNDGDVAMSVSTQASVPEQKTEHCAVPQLILVLFPLQAVAPAQRTSQACVGGHVIVLSLQRSVPPVHTTRHGRSVGHVSRALSQAVVPSQVISQTPLGQPPQFDGHGGPPVELELALEAVLVLAVDDASPDEAKPLELLPPLEVDAVLDALDVDELLAAPTSVDAAMPVTSIPQPAAMPSIVTTAASTLAAIG